MQLASNQKCKKKQLRVNVFRINSARTDLKEEEKKWEEDFHV